MSRDTMVYYRSFRESLRELPPDLYKVVSETIFDYAFEGIAPVRIAMRLQKRYLLRLSL